MAAIDDEIDRLFQVPLNEFTPARNALAKGAGPDAAAVKRLHRPQTAAWVVNQLFWRRRKTYDRLIAASQALRGAHAAALTGRRGDLAAAEQEHRAALRSAMDDVRTLLAESGEKPTPATITAANETLQALPHPTEAPGRLVRPLKPLGFEALTDLLTGPAAAPAPARRTADVVPFDRARGRAAAEDPAASPRARKEEAGQRRRDARERAKEEAARRRETARLEKEVHEARARDREAQKQFARAREAVEAAERERDRAEQQLKTAAEALKRLQKTLEQQELEATSAALDLARVQRQLQSLM
jgi:hypothetical protein